MYSKKIISVNTFYHKTISIYYRKDTKPRASLLYLHGGGLIFGDKDDLPQYHINKLTEEGFLIFAFDYPLAPESKIETIVEDCIESIKFYNSNIKEFIFELYDTKFNIPYFLFGRSSGAYLSLLCSSKISGNLKENFRGIISYYGYGLFFDNWHLKPNTHYNKYPKVKVNYLSIFKNPNQDNKDRFILYLKSRQDGTWKDLIFNGKDKDFYLNYSLRSVSTHSVPIFFSHSINDPDVPYSEFIELSSKYVCDKYIVSSNLHDFDSDTNNQITVDLLKNTVKFINNNI